MSHDADDNANSRELRRRLEEALDELGAAIAPRAPLFAANMPDEVLLELYQQGAGIKRRMEMLQALQDAARNELEKRGILPH